MKKLYILLGAIVALAVLVVAGYVILDRVFADPAIRDTKVVGPHLAKDTEDGMLVFDAGPFKGGTAILTWHDRAYWVKDGKGYVVNEAARQVAPDLDQAPADIIYDDAFIAAARRTSP